MGMFLTPKWWLSHLFVLTMIVGMTAAAARAASGSACASRASAAAALGVADPESASLPDSAIEDGGEPRAEEADLSFSPVRRDT